MAVLTVDALHLRYGDNPILKGVSMTLARGEVVALLGPSGSGKTTLLRAVAGLETPHSGSIRIADRTVFDDASGVDVAAELRNLGLVFQSYALWPHRTVFDNVAYGLRLRRVPSAEIRERVGETLANLGLAPYAARFPHQLSGGQQQRVALARALVYKPPVILLDEPLSNLDAKLREEARAWLRKLIVTLDLSALCVTHDQSEAMAIADRILLLNQGVIEQQGTPTEMYTAPRSLFTAEFMGSNNRLSGELRGVAGGRGTLATHGVVLEGVLQEGAGLEAPALATAVVRIEALKVREGPGGNRVRLPLVTSMYLGDRWEHVFGFGSGATETLRAVGPEPLAAGEHWVEFPADRVWIFAGG